MVPVRSCRPVASYQAQKPRLARLGRALGQGAWADGAAGAPLVAAAPFVGRAFEAGEQVVVSWDSADVWPVT